MADKKISQLPAATFPLAGTELLPIVQSGTTDNITVNNLAVGNIKSNATTGVLQVVGPAAASTRVMTTPDANFTVARTDAAQSFTDNQTLSTGNLVIGTSGKGIDFSATSEGSGTMTSELLADYEEGTFTVTDASGAALGFVASSGYYTKIGRIVTVFIQAQYVNTANASNAKLGGLPYAAAANPGAQGAAWGFTNGSGAAQLVLNANGTSIDIYSSAGAARTNANMSNTYNFISFSYTV